MTKVVPRTLALYLPFSLRKGYIWFITFAFSLQIYLGFSITCSNFLKIHLELPQMTVIFS